MNANPMFKKLLIGCTSMTLLALLAGPVQADPPDRDHLPPGLAKKDKLPPGWQKKVAKQRQDGTNAPTPSASPANPTPPAATPTSPDAPKPTVPPKPAEPGPAPDAKTTPPQGTGATSQSRPLTREQQQRYARLDQALAELETEAARPGASDRLIIRLARVTDIPQAKLRAQWNAHPGVSIGQFYLATAIATRKHITVDPVLAERKAGKSWGEIAEEYRVNFGDLVQGLRGAEEAAKNAAQKAERQAQQVAK